MEGANTVCFLTHEQIKQLPDDQNITYAHIIVDYCCQNHVSITAGGHLINYPDELTTRTADLMTTKMLWNRGLSTHGPFLDVYACQLHRSLMRFLSHTICT